MIDQTGALFFASNYLRYVLLTVVLSLALQPSFGKIRLPALVGDKMILQRDIELNIWGWAAKGEKVTIRFRDVYYYTEAGSDGRWKLTIPPQHYGGPYIMEINELVIRDVLIGDVWLCSGQSNMETPIQRLVERFPEINVSNNHMIRYFKVPMQNSAFDVKDAIPSDARWHSAIASDVMNWTALAYFYAQEAYQHTGVPVGMLVSSLGGSTIESWIDQQHLIDFPDLLIDRTAVDSLKTVEKDRGAELWTKENFNDTNWSIVQVPEYWAKPSISNRGVVYYRKHFVLPAAKNGRYAKLYLGTLIDSDSVYVNGHFVGTTAYRYPPRIYDVPAGILHEGNNTITIRLRTAGVDGGFTPDKPYKLQVDDTIIDLAGDWRWKVGLDQDAIDRYKERLRDAGQVGSGLYNGMINPLKDYGVKGVIWYQGEANTADPKPYQRYLALLIDSWRELFQQPKLPFLLVQLPNFMAKDAVPKESSWALVREAQFQISKEIPMTALAVTYDIGEWNDIHPLNKKDLAKRLFLAARKLIYGEHIVAAGPRYKAIHINGDEIAVSFDQIGKGLAIAHGTTLQHFAIAGEDQKFFWADAVIRGRAIIVSHPKIKHPKAVRYAWGDNPVDANLINKEGFLAIPFRTDNW